MQAISESVTQQEDDSVLKCLIELAENVPKFLRPQGENVVAFCMKVRMRNMVDTFYIDLFFYPDSVILLPVHPASFAHNFVSGMQSFYFNESQDAIVLQTCH